VVASDNGVLSSYDVLFSTDGGSSYSPVPGCSGLAGWICNAALPGPASANARLRVVAHDASGNSGIRDWLISIVDPAITVTLPNTNLNWHVGVAGTIRWYDTLGYGENVKIELSRDGRRHVDHDRRFHAEPGLPLVDGHGTDHDQRAGTSELGPPIRR
jgi:subtilisin family serine protease